MVNHRFGVVGVVGAWLLVGCAVGADGAESLAEEQAEIVGGTNADISEFPHQVSLQFNRSHFCGGSVLSSTWILTAQHCVKDLAPEMPWLPPSLLSVVAGTTNVTQKTGAQVKAVAELVPLPGYVDPTTGKDAALLRLSSALDLTTAKVAAIPIVTPEDEANGATAPGVTSTVTGWGTLREGGSLSRLLQAVDVPIVSNEDASPPYEAIGYPPLTSDQLAAGFLGVGGKDSCQGDSGGPLVVDFGGATKLAGIVSWGEGCARAEYAGLYGRVASFADWIEAVQASTAADVLNQTGLRATTRGSWSYFQVEVPADALVLNVKTSGGNGNADLYVRFGSQPSTSAHDCDSRRSGNTEYCSLAAPAAGTWHIGLRVTQGYSNVTLNASLR